jgi:hypothetical protein
LVAFPNPSSHEFATLAAIPTVIAISWRS